jgi:nitroimidazol reductase NimA-like FMN-containing flavoprotein (pyridoxamine 5'-phosphate oxidase superfamily)
MFGKLNSEQIETLLRQQVVGRIGCDGGDQIYVVPVSYAYDGKYIYVHSLEGKKIEMMRRHPKVCFQVDDMPNMANWQSVIAWGKFEELSDVIERNKALKTLIDRHLPQVSSATTHLGGHWPFQPEDFNTIEGIVFRIEVQEKTGRFEKSEAAPITFSA